MPDLSYLLEKIDTESPGDVSIAVGATEATLFFIVEFKDIYRFYLETLGYTTVSTENRVGPNRPVGLSREIPMSHPYYPWLYAQSVEIQGIGANGYLKSEQFGGIAFFNQEDPPNSVTYKTTDGMDIYKKYRIAVRFKSLPYLVLNDSQLDDAIRSFNGVGIKKFSYWDFDPLDPLGNKIVEKSYWDGCEYLRYTQMFVEPDNEVLVNESGKGYWKSIALGNDKVYLGAPSFNQAIQVQSAGVNYVNVTTNKVRIVWYQVPKRVALNLKYINNVTKINYGANYNEDPVINTFNYPFFGYEGGTLLFTGITTEPSRYGFPKFVFTSIDRQEMYTNLRANQYYDITFNFIELSIPQDNIELPNLANFNPKQGKMYSNGWNFVPYVTRQWYYIENQPFALKENALPRYWSYPFQALFDPVVED
jgi:hypothetical protein